jgi:hypothetical protein
MFILLWIVALVVSWQLKGFEANAKMGFSEVTYWIGFFLGNLVGIVSIKLQNAYKN